MSRAPQRPNAPSLALLGCAGLALPAAAQSLPFNQHLELYRGDDPQPVVFALRLEQSFLAEEFEKSNTLRLEALDEGAFLIYPRETRFDQKHAAFYGRLRGAGAARLRLSYESVAEGLDGAPQVQLRTAEIEVPISEQPVGPESLLKDWARQQNAHFLRMLSYHPNDSFLQFALLQSKERYDISPPALPTPATPRRETEVDLYRFLGGASAVQEALQSDVLRSKTAGGPADVHISAVPPPQVRSPQYEERLKEHLAGGGQAPRTPEVARLIPEDQYFLLFNGLAGALELFDLSEAWGGDLWRLLAIRATDGHSMSKLEQQLCLPRAELERLAAAGAIGAIGVTGGSAQFAEGADVTLLFQVLKPDAFEQSAVDWLADARRRFPQIEERDFHYRGQRVTARFTTDRAVSAFGARIGDWFVASNSHVGLRRILDAAAGSPPSLAQAPDFAYLTALLAPSDAPGDGYLYVSDACIRRLIGPEMKIAEKRRRQCFNHLVMLHNASMLFRMENERSPESLSELVTGRFIDPKPLACPHGGAYAYHGAEDAAACSLHNRLNRMTPACELGVLTVTRGEADEYARFRERYEEFWQGLFDPIAVRIATGQRMTLEACVLPLANGGMYDALRGGLAERPQPLHGLHASSGAVASLALNLGRERLAGHLRGLPGFADVLAADPTLTDLNWLGERVSLHLCDGDTILEVDPSQLRPLNFFGEIPLMSQALASAALLATSLPAYVCVDLEDPERARRFLELLPERLALKNDPLLGLETAYDAYRLPDYQGHARYVIAYQVYALKARLHLAIVDRQLVAATKEEALRQVIDSAADAANAPAPAHVRARLNLDALQALRQDIRMYWAERARQACHSNLAAVYELASFYDTPPAQLDPLALAKYGVTYACPEGGAYALSRSGGEAECSLHGGRRGPRQNLTLESDAPFARLLDELERLELRLTFQEQALYVTAEIARR